MKKFFIIVAAIITMMMACAGPIMTRVHAADDFPLSLAELKIKNESPSIVDNCHYAFANTYSTVNNEVKTGAILVRLNDIYLNDIRIKRVVDSLVDGTFSDESSGMFREIYNSLLYGADYHRADNFYVLLDLMPYIDAKWKTNRDYQNRIDFGRKCLYNMTCSGIFSSDRTVKEYAKDIWKL